MERDWMEPQSHNIKQTVFCTQHLQNNTAVFALKVLIKYVKLYWKSLLHTSNLPSVSSTFTICHWRSCRAQGSVAMDESRCDIHHLGITGPTPHAIRRFHQTYLSDVFPFGLFFSTAATAGMAAIYHTSFNQLLQSAAAFMWRLSEFIGTPPPRLKHQILFLRQQPLNSDSTYQLWNHHRGTTALGDLHTSQLISSAGITVKSPKWT